MSERILVIQMAKLGDFIQSTPLLANARRKFPGTELVLAGEQPAVLEAARLSPLVDFIRPVETEKRPDDRYKAVFVLNSHRRAMETAAGVSAEQYYGPRLTAGAPRFTPAQEFLMALMGLRRDLGRFNLVDVWASLVSEAIPTPLVWPAQAGPARLSTAEGFKIGLQLGSRNHLRRWPAEHFAALIAHLADLGLEFTPVLLGSNDERALGRRLETLLSGRGRPPINLMGATDLAGLGAAVAELDLLITADTGVLHLAAAVGTPALALFFGPAFGPETGPYGPGHLIYQAAAPCAPCRENGDCRRRQCLEMPAPDVAARLAALQLTDGAAELPALPPGHRVWRTEIDGFGQVLRPLGRPMLTAPEALALVVGEAGRNVLRPDYRPEAGGPAARLADYERPGGLPALDGAALRILAEHGFSGRPQDGARFVSIARRLALDLGFNFA